MSQALGPGRGAPRGADPAQALATWERGAALVLAILVLAILSVIGIGLALVTGTESAIAANEWAVNRAFYAADAGLRWGTIQMNDPWSFLARPEFEFSPFGTVFFQLPSHRHGVGGLFAGDMENGDIAVRIEKPSLLGRRYAPATRINVGDDSAQYIYVYEMRSTSSDQAFARYSSGLVAEIEVGPLPATGPGPAARAILLPPEHFPFLSSNVTPRAGTCGMLPDCSYASFARFHRYRRRAVFVESEEGFLHAFDAGVRDAHSPRAFDLGTGQEIFAYDPKSGIRRFPEPPRLPPQARMRENSLLTTGDAFIGPTDRRGAPIPSRRQWKTILVGGLRRGGRHYFALDITQPDRVRTDVPPDDIRYGSRIENERTSPDCLDGGRGCAAPYPTVLWEMTDDCAINTTTCVSNMGETWSRPVVGRIKVITTAGVFEDRYVAVFGGGFDPAFDPGTEVVEVDPSGGRAFSIVDVETGRIIYKASSGKDDAGHSVLFAPMPASPAVADLDDDGYLDVAYIGDLNGRIWKIDLTPDPSSGRGACGSCGEASETLTGYRPLLLFDPTTPARPPRSRRPVRPIFSQAGIILVAGGPPPELGIAFGTGDLGKELRPKRRVTEDTKSRVPSVNRLYVLRDSGAGRTLREEDLNNVTPRDGIDPGSGPAAATKAPNGYFLNFGSYAERAVSTVFAERGVLTAVTATVEGAGEAFRYRLLLRTGQGAISGGVAGPAGQVMARYREKLGAGSSAAAQGSPMLKASTGSWKEQ